MHSKETITDSAKVPLRGIPQKSAKEELCTFWFWPQFHAGLMITSLLKLAENQPLHQSSNDFGAIRNQYVAFGKIWIQTFSTPFISMIKGKLLLIKYTYFTGFKNPLGTSGKKLFFEGSCWSQSIPFMFKIKILGGTVIYGQVDSSEYSWFARIEFWCIFHCPKCWHRHWIDSRSRPYTSLPICWLPFPPKLSRSVNLVIYQLNLSLHSPVSHFCACDDYLNLTPWVRTCRILIFGLMPIVFGGRGTLPYLHLCSMDPDSLKSKVKGRLSRLSCLLARDTGKGAIPALLIPLRFFFQCSRNTFAISCSRFPSVTPIFGIFGHEL